jgi:hypothetical protein
VLERGGSANVFDEDVDHVLEQFRREIDELYPVVAGGLFTTGTSWVVVERKKAKAAGGVEVIEGEVR